MLMKPSDMKQNQPTLLAVLAHPDDETFGTGGTLALYAQKGMAVHLVCATRGEVGTVDENLLNGGSIADVRMNELRCAAGILGITSVHFLDYRDSGMSGSPENIHPNALAAAPLEEATERIVKFIRMLRPQVVITFDPVGGYRHPDHIAIHQATVCAFFASGDPNRFPCGFPAYAPQKLYFQSIPRGFLRFMIWLMPLLGRNPRYWGKNGDIDMVSIAKVNYPMHARVNYQPVSDIRDRASACHASQGGGGFTTGIYGWIRKRFAGYEGYMRAFPVKPAGEPFEMDLFAGVNFEDTL